MKRDMDLIRDILLEVEKCDYDGKPITLKLEGYDEDEITYHVMILAEADLIEAFGFSSRGGIVRQPLRLTWSGHDFLDASRDETIWKSTTKTIGEKVQSVSFDVLKAILVSVASEKLGLT